MDGLLWNLELLWITNYIILLFCKNTICQQITQWVIHNSSRFHSNLSCKQQNNFYSVAIWRFFLVLTQIFLRLIFRQPTILLFVVCLIRGLVFSKLSQYPGSFIASWRIYPSRKIPQLCGKDALNHINRVVKI